MGEKKSFVLHKDYHNQIKKLPDEDAAALLRAIFAYVNGEEVGELSPLADMVFSFIRAQLDRDAEKYKIRCEKSKKAAEARWNNAEKANANSSNAQNANACECIPSNAQNANACECIPSNAQNADNDSDSDNDSDNDSGSDNDVRDDITAVFNTFEHCGFQITGYTAEELPALIEEYSAEWVIEALKRSADRGNKTLGYVKGILNSWNNQGAIDSGTLEYKKPEIKPKIDESMNDLDGLF